MRALWESSIISFKFANPCLRRKLTEAFSPTVLKLVNESHKHAHHKQNPKRGPDAETHFKYGSGWPRCE